MRQPTVSMTRNLRFTSSGGVWAEWLVRGQPYGLRSLKDKTIVKDLHQALVRALPGESLLLGVCSGTDPGAVVESMLAGVDRESCPAWVTECEATMESLEEIPLGSRVFYLAVPLTPPSQMERLTGPLRANLEGVKRRAGLPPQMPSPEEIQRWQVQADRVAAGIPSTFSPVPATPAQMVWLHGHMIRRGLWLDPDMPGRTTAASTKTSAALVEAILDEGGLTDAGTEPTQDTGRKRPRSTAAARLSVLRNRFVKVTDTSTPDLPASYQSMSVISDVPEGELLFPGSEILGRIDESGLDVDFAIRMSVHSSSDVSKANQKALRNLNDQLHQREGEASHAGDHLGRLQNDLAEYVGILSSEKLEVEVRATLIFCVAGPTPETAMDQHRALASWLAAPEYKVLAPIGYQEALWWAMHPGVPTGQKVREFAQIAPSKTFAKLVPIATNGVGDRHGSAFALNITNGPLIDEKTPNGLTSVIRLDPEGASDRRVSGSLAVAGEMGAGKALDLDTPIPTPTGWSRMGDLAPGDMVFDEQGRPTQVLGASPVMTDHDCYEVTFSDGSTIVADAEHLWTTIPARARSTAARPTQHARRASRSTTDLIDPPVRFSGPGWPERGVTVTTEQIRASLLVEGRANHAVPVTAPLELPAADLPVDPYTLGVWLGSGDAWQRRIFSAAPETLTGIESVGYQVGQERDDVTYSLVKHIPPIYLRASATQRRAVLAGLLDAQGPVSRDGDVEFTSTSQSLVDDVHDLVCSLGHRAALWQGEAGPAGQTSWTVSFAHPDPLTHRVSPLEGPHDRSSSAAGAEVRFVVDVQPVASVPVRCIRVASASRLFLAGRSMIATHNTATLMKVTGDVADRGGQFLAIDRTSKGEWGTWAASVTDTILVSCADPKYSLDPLRIFGLEAGSQTMQTFLTPLLNAEPTSEVGVLLSDILNPDYLREHGIDSAGALVAHVKSGCSIPGSRDVARLLQVYARRDVGRIIFNPELPALPLDLSGIVIHTAGLPLPTREELQHEHLFRQLSLEKIFSRALHALIAAIAHKICYSDTTRLAAFVVSEVHALTVSSEGEQILGEFIRDGRKHRAVAYIDSHDPLADFGSETLRRLIPNRLIMRHVDPNLAKNCLEWIGLDASDDELVDLITKDTSPLIGDEVPAHRRGEGLLRDARGNIARAKVLLPYSKPRRAAIEAAGNAAVRGAA